jgi:ketosteroid isomerase-like protein
MPFAVMENTNEIQDLLDRMGRAVTAGDGKAVTQIWETPAFVVSDDNVMVVSSLDEVAQFFGGAREQYNDLGITDTRAEIVTLNWPTENIAIVQVRWPYLDAHGKERGEETSTYTLRRGDDGALKLRIAVMHGAKS